MLGEHGARSSLDQALSSYSGHHILHVADRGSRCLLDEKTVDAGDVCFDRWWAARIKKKQFLERQWINGGMWLRLRVNTRHVATTFIVLRQVL